MAGAQAHGAAGRQRRSCSVGCTGSRSVAVAGAAWHGYCRVDRPSITNTGGIMNAPPFPYPNAPRTPSCNCTQPPPCTSTVPPPHHPHQVGQVRVHQRGRARQPRLLVQEGHPFEDLARHVAQQPKLHGRRRTRTRTHKHKHAAAAAITRAQRVWGACASTRLSLDTVETAEGLPGATKTHHRRPGTAHPPTHRHEQQNVHPASHQWLPLPCVPCCCRSIPVLTVVPSEWTTMVVMPPAASQRVLCVQHCGTHSGG